jgi:hypothetical protein
MTSTLPVAFVLCTLVALALAQQPSPPLWDQAFKFVASVQYQPANAATQSMQYHYRWDVPAVAQVVTNELGQTFTILNVKNNTWRVTPGNRTCCLCTNPYACGHVTPPTPDWLQRGNDTKYLGVTSINERDCHGWAKSNPAAVFGWWTSVKTGTPCQLSWLLGMTINMVMASYTNDPALVTSDVFDIPSYCPYHETDPNCSISGF